MNPLVSLTLLAFGTMVVSAAEPKATSEYTTTDPKKVKILEDSSRDKDAEGDSFMHQCPGLGGYKVIHEGGDLRSWINLVYNGKKTDLMQDTFSLDDKAVYFNSAAWAVSGSVQKVMVATKEIRFVTDGDSVMVVPQGKHAGWLLICRELIKNDKHGESMGRGSYLWMFSPEGKNGKEVKSTEGYTAEDYLKDQGIRP